MPDLQLNYAETPPWLKNDAQESNFLRDVQAGQQIIQQRQQFPLKLKAMQQDVQMQDLKISEAFRQRDDLLQAEQAAQGLSDTVAPLLDQEQPERAMSALLAAGVRKPILFKSPQWQVMMKEVQAAVTAQRAQKQLETLEGLRLSQEEENRATADWRRSQAEKAALIGDAGIEILDITGTGKKAVRVKGANTLHIVEPEKLSRVEEIEYQQALRDLSAIDRELAKEPPHPTGRDEKGEKVPIISDKRNNLLKQRRAAEERIGAVVTKQGGTSTTAPATVPAPAPEPTFPSRPPGLTDDELKQQAAEAIKQGKDPAWVEGALKSWGVK